MTWCQAPERRLLRSAAALAVVLALGACDFPTEAPIFQSRYVIPTDNTTLTVDKLLPGSITVVGSNFQLALAPVSINKTLGELCPACVPFNGLSVPYPGFTASIPVVIQLPSDVSSAVLASGAVTLSIQNTFGLDPLNPPGAATGGTMTITVTNGSRTLGATSVTGPFPTGTTKTATVQLAPGSLQGEIDITIGITSPAGGVAPANFVTVNTNGALNVTATPAAIAISSANVAVISKQVSVQQADLDLSDIDESIANHAVSGAIVLKITNPFAVSGTLTLKLADRNSGATIATKSLTIDASAVPTTKRVEFTGAELKQILGHDVTLSISGPVSSTGGFVTLTPGQVIRIETSLDVVVDLGGTVKSGTVNQ